MQLQPGWLVGHFSHRKGTQSWTIDGVAAQGYNVGIAGAISMGESWHNNPFMPAASAFSPLTQPPLTHR